MRFFGEVKSIEIEKKTLSPETRLKLSDEDINWLHGSSSILLSTLIQTGLKELIPSGGLKDTTKTGLSFPLFPISATCDTGTFDLDGSRKHCVNSMALSGCDFNKEGVELVLKYASSKKIISLSDRFEKFKLSLESLEESRGALHSNGIYKREMKLLLISLHHSMICYPEWNEFKEEFLKVINQAEITVKNSTKIHGHNKDLIDKYLKKMRNTILKEEIAFKPTKKFYEEIQNPFPIIIAANLEPDKFMAVDSFDGKIEKAFVGNIPLSDIKFILAPEENQVQLQQLVNKLELSCAVLTYVVEKEKRDVFIESYKDSEFFKDGPPSLDILEENPLLNDTTVYTSEEEEDQLSKLEKLFRRM